MTETTLTRLQNLNNTKKQLEVKIKNDIDTIFIEEGCEDGFSDIEFYDDGVRIHLNLSDIEFHDDGLRIHASASLLISTAVVLRLKTYFGSDGILSEETYFDSDGILSWSEKYGAIMTFKWW